MGIVKMGGGYFWLRFRRHFFRHRDFLRFKISKKKFLKIWILGVIEQCIGWFLYTHFQGDFLFGLTSSVTLPYTYLHGFISNIPITDLLTSLRQ